MYESLFSEKNLITICTLMYNILDTHVHLEFWHVGVVRSAYPPYGMQEVGSWFVPAPAVAQCYGVARLRSNQYESKIPLKNSTFKVEVLWEGHKIFAKSPP